MTSSYEMRYVVCKQEDSVGTLCAQTNSVDTSERHFGYVVDSLQSSPTFKENGVRRPPGGVTNACGNQHPVLSTRQVDAYNTISSSNNNNSITPSSSPYRQTTTTGKKRRATSHNSSSSSMSTVPSTTCYAQSNAALVSTPPPPPSSAFADPGLLASTHICTFCLSASKLRAQQGTVSAIGASHVTAATGSCMYSYVSAFV